MKIKSTLAAALMVLAAFLGSFLGSILVNHDEVSAAINENGRFIGWAGNDVGEFFILDTKIGRANWFLVGRDIGNPVSVIPFYDKQP